jgi:hypothetical protein
MRAEILTIGILTAAASCTISESAPTEQAAVAAIDVWEPIDPGFKGCEGG